MCFRPPTVENGSVRCPKCGAEADLLLDVCSSCGAKAVSAPGMSATPGVAASKAPLASIAPKPPGSIV